MTNAWRPKDRLSYGPPGFPPATWEVGLAKRWITVQSGDMISAVEETEIGHPVIGGNGIRAFTDKTNTPADTLVVGRVGARCGCVHHIREDFWASEHAYRVIEKKPLARRFFFHLLTALDLNRFAIKTAQPLLNTEIVETQLIAVPPLPEQTAIAAFLDRETGKIDALVEEQKRLIELLKEKRQAVISHAVTKGLDPNVAMKPTGIEWLGDVPEHWEVVSLRHELEALLSGITDTQIDQADDTVPVTRIETISSGVVNWDRLGYVSNAGARADRRLRRGDILFSNINSLSMIGNTAQFDDDAELYLGMNLLALRPSSSVYPSWLAWLARAPIFRQSVEALAKPAINQASISQSSLLSIKVPRPPAEEQQAIAHWLRDEVERLELLHVEAERSVHLLRERRAALISAAVTGKIDVRSVSGSEEMVA